MTERRDTQSAETTHSVWEALPHATVRYQTVCSAVKDNPGSLYLWPGLPHRVPRGVGADGLY